MINYRTKSSCLSCTVMVTAVLRGIHTRLEQPSLSHSSQFLEEIKHMTPLMYESLSLLPPSLFPLCCPFPVVFPSLVPHSASRSMISRCVAPLPRCSLLPHKPLFVPNCIGLDSILLHTSSVLCLEFGLSVQYFIHVIQASKR